MKKQGKVLLTMLCAVLLVVGSVFGTLAYLTDQESVLNTFTVGNVDIELKEDGMENREDGTVGLDYHLLPGHTYDKDPTVTVKAGSEETYVRMMVTVNYSAELDAIFAPTGVDLITIFAGYNAANWALVSNVENADNTRTYEFRYVGTEHQGTAVGTVEAVDEDTELAPLFTQIKIPGTITKEQLATLVTKDANGNITDQLKITVVAHAIQASGMTDANDAWSKFR